MVISFHPVVYAHQKRKDGTYNVKIRVTFKGVSRHLPTTYYAEPRQLTRSLKLRDPALIGECERVLSGMRASVAKLSPLALESLTVDDVVRWIKRDGGGEDFRLDFFEYGEAYAKQKSESTARTYTIALAALERFVGARFLDIGDITASFLREFVAWNQGRGVKNAFMYMQRLSTIYSAAKREFNDEDAGVMRITRDPFHSVEVKEAVHDGQKALPVEVLQKMVDDRDCGENMRYALDCFLLSFQMFGANMADLYRAEPPRGGVWIYRRKKTENRRADGALMKVRVPEELGEILGRLEKGAERGRWLSLSKRYSGAMVADNCVNRQLKIWAKMNGLEEFTFYAARKSFATIARKMGVEKATIDECLCHVGDYRVADIYIERDYERLENVSKIVTSVLRWRMD